MYLSLSFALACAVVDWIAVARQNSRLEYIFKPATMLAVIGATLWLMQSPHDAWQARWFLAAFVFSLAGDIFLMLPDKRWFIFGLGAFLVAHLCYILGLNPTLPPAPAFLLLVPIVLVVGSVVWRVVSHLRAADHASLVPPVMVYGAAMALMLFSAWATIFRPEWSETRRVLVIVGATLFFISDAMLAWNRFVKPFDAAKLGVIMTYHLAQIAFAASILT